MNKEEFKNMLEQTALNSDVKVEGEKVELKSEEQKQSDKDFEDWKNLKSEKIIKTSKTELYKEYLKLILKGDINSLICVSKAGYGKTYTTINFLKEMKEKFVYKSGYITPLSFYCFMFENRDKTIILDDLGENAFKDSKMIAILKSCLYQAGGERIVSYDTTSDKLSVPSLFKFTGKVILLANEVGNNRKENFNALISRAIFFELKYSYDEILEIAQKILINKKLPIEIETRVLWIISENVNKVSNFSFRKLEQLIEMVKHNEEKAEDMFCHSFKQDKILSLVCELMKLPIPVKFQAEKFKEETGFSTRKYYRLKTRINDEN